MPRGYYRGKSSKALKAAQVYLEAERDGDSLTISAVADRFGVSKHSVSNALLVVRRESAP